MSRDAKQDYTGLKQTLVLGLVLLLLIGWYNVGQAWLLDSLVSPDKQPTLAKIIRTIFPNLDVALSRMSPDQVLEKLNQLVLRFLLVVGLAYFLLRRDYRYRLYSLWQSLPSHKPDNWWRYVLAAGLIWFGYDIAADLFLRVPLIETAYNPPSMIAWGAAFILPKPQTSIIIGWAAALIVGTMYWLYKSANATSSKQTWPGKLVFILFVIGQCWLYSFQKIDHTYATFNWVAWVILWQPSHLTSRLAVIAIVVTYALAGIEKLLVSGIYWSDAASITSYLQWHATSTGQLLLPYPWLVSLLSTMAMLLQVSSLLLLKYRRFVRLWVPSMVAFHYGTLLLFGAGAWVHPWFWGLGWVWNQFTRPATAQESVPSAESVGSPSLS